MVSNRNAGILGLAACVIFWGAMFVLGALRPSYSHLANDISELGAMGTPNALAWNVLGFIIPGLCLVVVAGRLALVVDTSGTRSGRLAAWILPLCGLGIAGQGVFPALMANGMPVITSWHTRVHLIVSLVSGVAWVVGLLLLIAPMKRNSRWRSLYLVNVAAILLVILGSFGRGGGLPDGLVQRIVDAIVFAWFALMSIRLIGVGGVKDETAVV